jgi:gamma-glutamyltranspeptidase/glutathione hydrolase
MARAAAVVLASDPDVAAVGNAILGRGNAVDAVVAGVFAAAGLHASVLLGPVQVLIGGAGAGLRAVDGRVRQPGLGNPRPRGFLPGDAIPDAARVGVPALPAALLAAATTYGNLGVAAVVGPGTELARARSKPRASVLQRLSERGPAAFAEAFLAEELTLAAGRMAGGLLSSQDMDELRPVLTRASVHDAEQGREVITVPWGASSVRGVLAVPSPGADVRVIVAADRNGLLAVGCYEVPRAGLAIDAFDLVAPFKATPVLRGETRVKPGEPRGSAAPIALGQLSGTVDLAAGLGSAAEAEAHLGAWLATYRVTADLERDAPLPQGLLAAQRAGAGWTTLGAT